jgi:hypothetical protein
MAAQQGNMTVLNFSFTPVGGKYRDRKPDGFQINIISKKEKLRCWGLYQRK